MVKIRELCVQTDIKQMFTYLDVEHIKAAVNWFLGKILIDEKRRARNKKFFLVNKRTEETLDCHRGRWTMCTGHSLRKI